MNISLLDTWLFFVWDRVTPAFFSLISVAWSFFGILGVLLICYGLIYIRRRRTLSQAQSALKKRYLRQVEAIRLTDTRYTEKLSLLIRKYLEEAGELERALKRTGKEIQESRIWSEQMERLTSLLDTGSYDTILGHKECVEARKYILHILS